MTDFAGSDNRYGGAMREAITNDSLRANESITPTMRRPSVVTRTTRLTANVAWRFS
jgi:hypothetical protein